MNLDEIIAEVRHETESIGGIGYIPEIVPDKVQKKTKIFSEEVPNLQLSWNSTAYGNLKICPTYYYYNNVLNRVPREENNHAKWGIIYQALLENYDREKVTGKTHEESILSSIKLGFIQTWNFNLRRPWTSDIPHKTRETVIRAAVWHMDKYENDPYETLTLSDGSAAVELSFRFPSGFKTSSGEEIILRGHIDRGIRVQEKKTILDHKSTQGSIGPGYFTKYNPNNQASLYMIGASVIFDETVLNMVIDVCQTQVKGNSFERGFVNRTPSQLEEWLNHFRIKMVEAERYAQENDWPMNDMACVSGDTIVSVSRGKNKGKALKIEELYRLFHQKPGPRYGRVRYGQPPPKFRKYEVETYLTSDTGGKVGIQKVLDVIEVGKKSVFQISTSDGFKIKATADHKFRAVQGWTRVDQLFEGDVLFCWNGGKGLKSEQKKPQLSRAVLGRLYFYPRGYGARMLIAGVPVNNPKRGRQQRVSVLTAEAKLNNLSLDEFVHILRTDKVKASKLEFLTGNEEVHHRDRNILNDQEGNIEVLTEKEHHKEHQDDSPHKLGTTIITKIEALGEESVYDIVMEPPHHNFIANGLVAHNCMMYSRYDGEHDTWSYGCPYRGVCGAPKSLRGKILDQMFVEKIQLDPENPR